MGAAGVWRDCKGKFVMKLQRHLESDGFVSTLDVLHNKIQQIHNFRCLDMAMDASCRLDVSQASGHINISLSVKSIHGDMHASHAALHVTGTGKAGMGAKGNSATSLAARVAAATQQRQKLEAILQQDRENLILEQSRNAGSPHAELHDSQLQDMVTRTHTLLTSSLPCPVSPSLVPPLSPPSPPPPPEQQQEMAPPAQF